MIYGGVFILFLIGCLAAKNYKNHIFLNCNKKEHPFLFVYPFVLFIIEKSKLYKYIKKNKPIKELLKAVYLYREEKQLLIFYWCKKCSIVFIIFMIGIFGAFVSNIKESNNSQLKSGYMIRRSNYGEGEKKVNLLAEVEDGEEKYKDEVEVFVEERKYNEEERKEKFKEAKEYINDNILGKNHSFEDVRYPLNFVKYLPDSPIGIVWELEDDILIDSTGNIHNDEVELEGRVLTITALIQYYDTTEEYPIFVRVKPKILTRNEQVYRELRKAVKLWESKDLTEENLTLPISLDGKKVKYSENRKGVSEKIFLYAILTAGVVFLLIDKELETLYKKRERELLLDYPEIMNKFVLLLGAGMTTKGAWDKIVLEYRNKREKRGGKKRYAYEEMLVTHYELCNGVTEVKAYECFGRRVKLLPYLKFSSLIAQNLKKGSKGLLELLEYEAIDAFSERKELAKRMGEEASTKLLIPMMVMLSTVQLRQTYLKSPPNFYFTIIYNDFIN